MMMSGLAFFVVFLRVLLSILCAETGWRYGNWYRSARNEPSTGILSDLMLGIALVQLGFLLFSCYALAFGHVPRGRVLLTVYFTGDSMVTLGTLLHLRPAWRLRQRVLLSVAMNFMWRAVIAVIIALVLLWFDLQ